MTVIITPHNVVKLPKVAILLATYNGQQFLPQQLDSLIKQTYPAWQIAASDDGSVDETLKILNCYKNQLGDDKLVIFAGPKTGFAANFLAMMRNTAINADLYAYADQDDIWEADKIKLAVDWLNTIPPEQPALYCSRSQLIDECDNHIGYSPLFTRKPSFANALVQTIGGGNTMVFNQAARDLLCQITTNNIVSHDWLAYLVVAGCGGVVHYDTRPLLRYRQHASNVMGTNITWQGRLVRVKMLLQGGFKAWNEQNILAINSIKARLTPENQLIFARFLTARRSFLVLRMWYFLRSGIYRQTLIGNLGLIIAMIFNKI